jgi:hypothetical protein
MSGESKPSSMDAQNGSAYRSYRYPPLREALLTLFAAMVNINPLILLPPTIQTRRNTWRNTERNIEMRVALQSIMTSRAEMEAGIKTLLHVPPHLGNTLHTIKAMLVKPTTFQLIGPTHNSLSLQDTTITLHSMMTKTERQQILGIPAGPHITTATITPNRRLHKVITAHMGMATAMLSIRRPREDGLPRFHQRNGCVSGFLDMRARSSVLHTRTLAFSMTNSNNMTTTPSSNLILDLRRWNECTTMVAGLGLHDWEKLW